MKILTANRLSDGIAVWLRADHSWAAAIDEADVAADAACEEKLSHAGHAAFLKNEVVDVNLIDVDLVDGEIVPRRLRERIRAGGPTIAVRADAPDAPARRAA
ncbi:nitrite reductase [Zhengella mangrovi]|uniref:Nitrite reductase n=1 Tax=Zhengella mangrovi TaxID=1982044 RepID=A0A2G1QTR4_9HYPH|nr:DUF2849 domain-containing protein [Zhengella mangrovi]PHP68875.1 nitrite reductase [Zhengella mangrovi]